MTEYPRIFTPIARNWEIYAGNEGIFGKLSLESENYYKSLLQVLTPIAAARFALEAIQIQNGILTKEIESWKGTSIIPVCTAETIRGCMGRKKADAAISNFGFSFLIALDKHCT
ncbi:50S ribosomal protein L15 [Striga asiatica]|uniref:50S ribosomal protein L15 n=1 Tax=Striga asiatica TaxID=4170 RepID=A0A5A7PXB9_STRAF|nr:50S ribosomal protein L15 [Striga asiatica]